MSEPTIDYRRVAQLHDEFTDLWFERHAFYLEAATGFMYVRQQIVEIQRRARNYVAGTDLDSEEFQDTCTFLYTEILTENFAASGMQQPTQGAIKKRNAPDGPNDNMLGQLCLVSFSDYWNEYLRKEYVIAKGHLDRNETNNDVVKERMSKYASVDLWGDIRYLRNSIVHKGGRAIEDVARCKVIKWFKPGDEIILTRARMGKIFLALFDYGNQLHSEQFPPYTFTIPKQ